MKGKNAKNVIANSGQWLACVLMSLGIVVELRYSADIGLFAITAGSLVFAVFTKIKYYTRKK